MGTQNIDKTFVGTSDPVTLHYSQSYYGEHIISNEKTTFNISRELFNVSKKILFVKFFAQASTEVTAGLALPAWTINSYVDEGTITNDEMRIVLTEDTVMGGMLFGAEISAHFLFEQNTWIPTHIWHKGWHLHKTSAHWNDTFSKGVDITFDLIPMLVDFIWDLRDKVPGFKKIAMLFPTSLLDHMQDTEHGIVESSGVFINAKIPVKWDIFFIARQLVEVGIDIVSGPLVEIVAVLVAVGEALISLEEEIGVQLGFGPEIDIMFPVRVRITDLVADNVRFGTLEFDSGTIIGTDPQLIDTTKNALDVDNTPVERIGVHCKHTLELLGLQVSLWSKISAFKVLSHSGVLTIDLVELLEKHLNFDLGLDSFNSSLTNEIGKDGIIGDYTNKRPDTIEVKFI
ncbi:MAG: hypothetical protein C0602_06225 [Denitrovibrio sp.]|nr:MAG: hypothetical protein C0602_06225 [Denitrovibrio sp.]